MTLFKITLMLFTVGIILFYLVGIYLSRTNQVSIKKPQTSLVLEDVSFESKSGAMLHGWYIQGEEKKAGILLMHGVHSNRLQMLNRAEILHHAGYSVLLFDFQGHGESIGKKITFGYLESLDAEAGYEYLKKRVGQGKIGVIGVSLGGVAAVLGDVKYKADAIILESVYPSIEKAIKNRLKIKIGSLGTYLLPILTTQLKIQLGIDPKELQPINQIDKVKGALFIISGTEDKRTTKPETVSLYNKAKTKKELWLVEGASHIDFDGYVPKEYTTKVLNFFNKNIIQL